MSKKPFLRINRTTRYLILISLFLLSVNITLGLILMRQSDAAMRTQIENRMLDVSNSAAAMLDADALDRLTADKTTPEYQSVLKILRAFQDNINLSYIYCVRDLGDGSFVFTIDPDVDPGEFGEPVARTEALYQASLGTPAVDKEPYGDRWGRFYSAYTPVFNDEHRITGIVAVDFSAEWYEEQLSNQVRSIFLICSISLAAAVILVALYGASFRKRFRLMLDEMNSLSRGIEELVHEASPGAEMRLHKEIDEASSNDEVTELVHEASPGAEMRLHKAIDEASSNDEVTELGNRIRALEQKLSDQISLVRAKAFVDGLTGLGNRAAYEEHVKRIKDAVQEGKAAFSLALFDMNGLKQINDRYGHERGDQAIFQVAVALRETFRDATLYRIGGDEFIAIFDTCDPRLADRLPAVDRALARTQSVSVAKGCASYLPHSDESYRTVFNRADNAMYNDKNAFYDAQGGKKR